MAVKSSAKPIVRNSVSRSSVLPEQLLADIQKKAYEISCERGGAPGSAMDDWLKAEQLIKAKYSM